MNNQEMFNSINKGVPSYVMLEIDTETIIRECAANEDILKKEFKLLMKLYRDSIIRQTGFTKSNEFFFDKFRLITSYKTAETRIYISPIPFITKLKLYLGVTNPSVDFNDQTLYQELLAAVNKLNIIQTSQELRDNFPFIYKDLELSSTSVSQLETYKAKHRGNMTQAKKDNLEEQYRLYHSFGLSLDFADFMRKQVRMYNNLVKKRQFIEGYVNRTPIDFSMFTGLDKEKFELYLADKYLIRAIQSEDDKEKQECIYYIATYIRETKTSKVKIKNEEGREVTFNSLLRRYKKFLQSNPIIRPIDEPREHFEGYNIRHVENHVKKYFFTDINWQIVPPGTEAELDRKVVESLNRQYNYLSPEERELKILERYALYERKRAFFDNSGYTHKFYGTESFEGYIAYIYENGEVLMEKFFSDYANCLPTIEEAIYNIKVVDFERLSRLSKPTLIKEKKCKRIIHRGNWESRSQAIIDRPITPESKEATKQLVLRLQPKKVDN